MWRLPFSLLPLLPLVSAQRRPGGQFSTGCPCPAMACGWSSQGILNTIFYCMFAVLRSRQPPHGHGPGGGGGGGPRVAAGPGAQHDRAQDHPHLRPQGGELATTIHNSQRMRLLIHLLALWKETNRLCLNACLAQCSNRFLSLQSL